MGEKSSGDVDPFDERYWGYIEDRVDLRREPASPMVDKDPLRAMLIAEALESFNNNPPLKPDRVYQHGEFFEPEKIPEGSFIKFRREYSTRAAGPDAAAAHRELEKLRVIWALLIAIVSRHEIDNLYDNSEGLHWAMRYDYQEGMGIVLNSSAGKAVYAIRERRQPTPRTDDKLFNRPNRLWTPKAKAAVETKYVYEKLHLPLHNPAPVGMSTQVARPLKSISAPHRRIERLTSVELFIPEGP
jgi:hypothetical protein